MTATTRSQVLTGRTTFWCGIAMALAGIMLLATALTFVLDGAGAVIGYPVAASFSGFIAVVAVAVARNLIRLFFVIVPTHHTPQSVDVLGCGQLGLGAIALACAIVAVVVVVGPGELSRVLRWGLVIVAGRRSEINAGR